MADTNEGSNTVPSWEAPEWLRRKSPMLAEVFPSCRLPLAVIANLQRILGAAGNERAYGEISRTVGAIHKTGSRHHPLTILDAGLLRRMHNVIPAHAMSSIEWLAAAPEAEVRDIIFGVLVLFAATLAAIPTLEDAAPELRRMLTTMQHSQDAVGSLRAIGDDKTADGVVAGVRQRYVEMKDRLGLNGLTFPNRKYKEQMLVLYLALITRGHFKGRTLRQSIASIASAALGKNISDSKVDRILKQHFEAWVEKTADGMVETFRPSRNSLPRI